MKRGRRDNHSGVAARSSAQTGADLSATAAQAKKSPLDDLVGLLRRGAEIEHSLLVQYLYAAYSLGGEQIPQKHRKMVEGWRSSILSVAKEEMGHLLTVQNLLTLLGSPTSLNRPDFRYDSGYDPFPPALEPLSLHSLSYYIYAEMPDAEELARERELKKRRGKTRLPKYRTPVTPDREQRIVAEVEAHIKEHHPDITPHRVGALYKEIIQLISDPSGIPDSAFNEASFLMQASWDEWGRGYHPGPRTLDPEGEVMRGPPLDDGKLPQDIGKLKPSERHAHVMVERMATRAQAVKALRALSGQGEAPHLREDDTGEPSHFDRFVQIYQELKDVENEGWKPTHDVPTNPTIAMEFVETANARGTKAKTAADWQEARRNYTLIKSACGNYFADLFNQRYRMLVTFLAHSFYLARSHPADQPSLRSMMMHRAFGEMYNLKTIAGLLVRLPLRDDGSGGCAAPPFQVPDDAILPGTDKEMWRLHLDLLDRAKSTCDHLLDGKNAAVRDQLKACGGKEYLKTLRGLDLKAKDWIEGVVAGLA